MMQYIRMMVLCVGVMLPLASVQAGEFFTLEDDQTLVMLTATERQEVDEDILVARFEYREENTSAKQVQDRINRKVSDALIKLKLIPSLKVRTEQYYVYPDYRGEREAEAGKPRRWIGSQTIIFESTNAEEVLAASGELTNMGFITKR